MDILKSKIIDALQFRIAEEERTARLYESMAHWLEYQGYFGTSKLYKEYAEEEYEHAEWAYKYLKNLGIKPITPELVKPQCEFKSLTEIVQLSYKEELLITKQCNDLAELCATECDYITMNIALKYTNEQIDEIEKFTAIIDMIEAFGDDPKALRVLDDELGKKCRINSIG